MEQGTILKKYGSGLILSKGKKILKKFHTEKLENIYLYGNILITQSVIKMCLNEKINIVYLTFYGKYIGKIEGTNSKNIELRIIQFKNFLKENFKENFSKIIVKAKLQNYRVLLLRLNQKLNSERISCVLFDIRKCINKLEIKKLNVKEIMGLEGKGSSLYFSVFDNFLTKNFIFNKRSRRPPLNPVNAMLSFGYTMLFNAVSSSIKSKGLDPMLGNLHSIDYGRDSLALDLMEEFRPIIVDSLVINLIVRNKISENDFTSSEIYPCILTDTARKLFLKSFENKLESRIKYLKNNLLVSYRKIIELQVRNYIELLKGETEYRPIIIR
jgi:CRISPR-associated protein Cas1